MATTVEVIADAIKAAGTPFIVGQPGGETVELMEATRQRDMRFILAKQEVAGAMIAATWGEVTGAPGLCVSTRGPGTANMVNGIAYAALDRAPLIAITDRLTPRGNAVGLRQRIDHLALYAQFVKWGTTVDATAIRHQVRRAIRTATAPAPGPVHFDMPQTETGKRAAEMPAEGPLMPNRLRAGPDRDDLKPALTAINQAKRPIILAGMGVLWDHAAPELVRFAEQLGAPVMTTGKCKGAVPEDHPLRAGCIIGGVIEQRLVEQADLIVTVGLDGVELQPVPWPYQLPVVAVSAIPSLDALVPADIEVLGDVKAILTRLAEWCRGGDWGEKAAAGFRRSVIDALNTPSTGLPLQRVMEVSRAVLPRDTIATCDAGAHRLLVIQKWQSFGPREFLTSNALGTMGYAVPGAIGARLAYPDRPVVAFAGDGSFLMAVAELQTSVREKLPITVVVLDDEEIGLIRVKQQLKGLPQHGIKIGHCDWEKIAQGFGADGIVVSTEQALADALGTAAKSDRTTVIGVKIDGSGYIDQFNALREL